jgi:hypothetical protein
MLLRFNLISCPVLRCDQRVRHKRRKSISSQMFKFSVAAFGGSGSFGGSAPFLETRNRTLTKADLLANWQFGRPAEKPGDTYEPRPFPTAVRIFRPVDYCLVIIIFLLVATFALVCYSEP